MIEGSTLETVKMSTMVRSLQLWRSTSEYGKSLYGRSN